MEAQVWNREETRKGKERVKRGGDFCFMVEDTSFIFIHRVDTCTKLGRKRGGTIKKGERNLELLP